MKSRVPPDLDGERADRVVAVLADCSRATARRLVADGTATFDGARADPKQRIPAGTELDVVVPEALGLQPEEIPFEVFYEDRWLAVIDKPPGVVVHPGAGRRRGTLAAGILARWPRVRGVGDEDRWGIVHRLDRDTSGLLLVGLEAEAFAGLRAAVAERRVTRTYRALVEGRVTSPTGTIEAPIARDPHRPTRFRVEPGGRPARTHYRRLAVWEAAALSLLEVVLETGRTHQIRVHMRAIGHPVVADPLYGHGMAGRRIWLHAAGLGFDHPITGERIEVESGIPDDLGAWLTELGEPDADGETG